MNTAIHEPMDATFHEPMETFSEPGIYYGVSREDYDALEAVNQSLIKKFRPNPRAWKDGLPEVDSKLTRWGNLFEALLFGEDPSRQFAILDNGQKERLLQAAREKVIRKTKYNPNLLEVRQWKAQHPGQFLDDAIKDELLDAAQARKADEVKWSALLPEYRDWLFEQARRGFEVISGPEVFDCNVAVQRCRRDPQVKWLLDQVGGYHSVMIVWRDPGTGLLCKGLIDFLPHRITHLADIKTNSDICGVDLETACRKFYYRAISKGYHIQAGCYLEGFRLAQEQSRGERPLDHRHGWLLLVSGSEKPYPVATFELPVSDIEAGSRYWHEGLVEYKAAMDSGLYPGLTENLGWVRLEKENWRAAS